MTHNFKFLRAFVICATTAFILFSLAVRAEFQFSTEALVVSQIQNEVRIPGETGTKFSLTEVQKGTVLGGRIYVGYKINKKNEFRLLYAPLMIERAGKFGQNIQFQGQSFSANTHTETLYKFNSYRLTYAYHFDPSNDWQWALGFTAKVRDAEIRLTQASTEAKKTDLGFVPLFHFQGLWSFAPTWGFRIDFDGLAAPQGRALDLSLYLEKSIWTSEQSQNLYGVFGYRVLEGGADNKKVYNFAWLQALVLGLRGEF